MPSDVTKEESLTQRPSGKNKSADCPRELNIIVKGGHDLWQIEKYLMKGTMLDKEVSHDCKRSYMVHTSHTEILKRSSQLTLKNYSAIIDMLLFLDRDAFRTRFLSSNYHVYIYSVLEDYTRGLYRYRNSDLVIPFGDFSLDLTDVAAWDSYNQRSEKQKLTKTFLEWFKGNFTFLGPIDPDSFRQNIAWMCGNIGREKLLIIVNGLEVENNRLSQQKLLKYHREMNQALSDTVQDMPHVVVCDVREFVCSPDDHSADMRQYAHRVYFRIGLRINKIIEARYKISLSFWQRQLLFLKYYLGVFSSRNQRVMTEPAPGF